MYKLCTIICILLFSIHIQLPYNYNTTASAITSDLEKANFRVGKHADFTRVVLTVPSNEILKNTSLSLTESKLIKITFLQPLILTFNKSGVEEKIPVGEGFIQLTSEIKVLPGTNFCLIQAEKIESYKLSKINDPPRLIIDIYTHKEKVPIETPKPTISTTDISLKRSFSTFLIDAGHGGYDKGIHDDKNREKDIALTISKEIAHKLSTKNKKAFLTRKADQRLSIKDRINFINSKSPDILISIHLSSSDEGYIYTYEDNKTSENTKNKIANDIALNLINNLNKDIGINLKQDKLPLPILMHVKPIALLIELPHFRNFTYDKKTVDKLVNAIIKSLTLSPEN